MSIELAVLTAHVPSICHRENVPEFQQNIVAAMDDVGKRISEMKPDLVFLVSTHWISPFNHYVDITPVHKGILTAFEAPDIINDVEYNYAGDEEMGKALVEAGKRANIPVIGVNDPTYVWDYGTVVPLRYLVSNEDVPVVNISVTMSASLEETYKLGKEFKKVFDASGKKVVFIASGALSHNLVRGRHNMPTKSEQALDKQFIDYVLHNDLDSVKEMLPQYSKVAGVEGGGRHLAMLLGFLEGETSFKPAYHGYAQSSGSGNAIMTFEPQPSKVTV